MTYLFYKFSIAGELMAGKGTGQSKQTGFFKVKNGGFFILISAECSTIQLSD